MKNNKLDWNGIITSLVEVLVGILLLINPIGFTSGIITAVGIALCIIGVKSVIMYFRTDAKQAAAGQELLKGLVCLLVGSFCVFGSYWFIATFPVLTMLYGVAMLLTGLVKIQVMADMIRFKSKYWYLAAISAGISLLCALIILMNPFSTTAVLWIFTAITLIVQAVLGFVTVIFNYIKVGDSYENG